MVKSAPRNIYLKTAVLRVSIRFFGSHDIFSLECPAFVGCLTWSQTDSAVWRVYMAAFFVFLSEHLSFCWASAAALKQSHRMNNSAIAESFRHAIAFEHMCGLPAGGNERSALSRPHRLQRSFSFQLGLVGVFGKVSTGLLLIYSDRTIANSKAIFFL